MYKYYSSASILHFQLKLLIFNIKPIQQTYPHNYLIVILALKVQCVGIIINSKIFIFLKNPFFMTYFVLLLIILVQNVTR